MSSVIVPPSSGAPSAAAVRLRGWLSYLDLTTPRATYLLRSVLAAGLALTVAYLLELESPYSAASTVLLVINPLQGAVIGKGTWRVLGTLAGMIASVALVGAFAQMPWLFMLGFGLWLGLCVAAMTLLRHFRASGAVVAGYTVGLATYGALAHPQLGFEHIISRGSTVTVGAICLGLVSALFSARRVRHGLQARLCALAAAAASTLASQHQAIGDGERVHPARRQLIGEIYAIDDLLALGKAESADLAARAVSVRQAMTSLFAAVAGGAPPLPPHSPAVQGLQKLQPALEQAWCDAAAEVARGAQAIPAAIHRLGAARRQLHEALAAVPVGEHGSGLLIAGDRLAEQIDDYLTALGNIAALQHPRPRRVRQRVPFHRDVTAAALNGLRAMVTLVACGALWIVTGWPEGDLMLAGVAAYCALLATAPNPVAGAVAFTRGTIAALPLAFLCGFVVLPQIDGMPLLLVVLALFWLPGIWATSIPRHALAGLAYLVGFNTLVAATNPMVFDPLYFLNACVAWILAVLLTVLSFRLLARSPAADAGRLRRRIRDDALAVLRGGRPPRRRWQLRQQHRMAQLGAQLKTQPAAMDAATGDALACLHLGRELLRLREWASGAPTRSPLRQRLERVLDRMARRAADPLLAARHARRGARAIGRAAAEPPGAPHEAQRLAAALADVAGLLEDHHAWFTPRARSRRHAQ